MLRAGALSAATAAAILVGCGGHARHHAPGRTQIGAGVSIVAPRGWHLLTPPVTALSYPVDRLLLTSYRAARGGNCGPDRAEGELPADGALVYLLEFRPRVGAAWPADTPRSEFPPRPAHFALRRSALANYECWHVPSYLVRFRAADRAFQLHVALGPRAGPARRAQVLRALDSLRFTPLPPPRADPYAGWHALHDETGDTLRTAPGWLAAVTPSPRRRRQPRTLFITANHPLRGLPATRRTALTALPSAFAAETFEAFPRDGVVLWIREAKPGPATGGWRRRPRFATVHGGPAKRWSQLRWRRAGIEQRHTRFELWIVSGSAASDSDRLAARKSAAAFAYSVGSFRNRPCRHSCESGSRVRVIPAARQVLSAADLERALVTNPDNPALATCHAATAADRRRARSFAHTRRLFVCEIALRNQAPATFDVQVLANRCFVAERRRRGQADYGCVR